METAPRTPPINIEPTPALPIAPTPEEQQKSEVIAVVGEHLQLAGHGLAVAIAERRMNRAGSRMERMDHKEALYSDIGNISLGKNEPTAETATGQPARARTAVERFMDKRLERKSWNAAMKKAQKDMELKQFGSKHWKEKDDGTGSEFVFDGLTRTTGKESRNVDRKRRSQLNREYKDGMISARKLHTEIDQVAATPHLTVNTRVKKLERQEKNAEKNVQITANQPYLSRWRDMRRNRAITSIKQNHSRTEKHKAKQAVVRGKLQDRVNKLPTS